MDIQNFSNIGSNADIADYSVSNVKHGLEEVPLPSCVCRGTLLKTIHGHMPVEALQVGTLVLTMDHGYRPVRWIGLRDSSYALRRFGPVRISRSALGENLPETDLYVSSHHQILVRSEEARQMFGEREVLVAASNLLSLEGVERLGNDEVFEYYQVIFDDHEIIFANGAPTGSMHPDLFGLLAAFPQRSDPAGKRLLALKMGIYPSSQARMVLTKGQANKLIRRHRENNKMAGKSAPLLSLEFLA